MAVQLEPLYPGEHYHAGLFALLCVIGFIATALLISIGECYVGENHKLLSSLALSAFVVLPPLWFFYEYFYYFPKYGNPNAGFERLKDAQEVTSKVWAAISVLLGVFYTLQFPA